MGAREGKSSSIFILINVRMLGRGGGVGYANWEGRLRRIEARGGGGRR